MVMHRRRFVFGSGVLLTTAAFVAACGHRDQTTEGARSLSPLADGAPPIVEALRYGITAPSPHNTQPWQFDLVSDTEARLFFDPERRLPATDPPARQGHIGHGTLLEVTAIAATHLGYQAHIEVLPEGEMTLEALGHAPTATIQLEPLAAGQGEDPLFSRVLSRRTSRLEHEGPALAPDEVDTIRRQSTVEGIDVAALDPGRLEAVLDIVMRAMAVEVRDYELYDETRIWFRFTDEEIARHGDGLNLYTSGVTGATARLAKRFLRYDNWHRKSNLRGFLRRFDETVGTTRGMLTFMSATNTMHDWIAAGRAYVRAQLSADALGLRLHPVSQAMQEYPQMDAIRAELDGKLGIAAPAKLQMLARIGRTQTPGLSPRREVSAYLS